MSRLLALAALVAAIFTVSVTHAAPGASRAHDDATPQPTPSGYHFKVLACWQAAGTDASTQPKCLKSSKAGQSVQAYIYTIIYNVPPKSKGKVAILIKQNGKLVSQAAGNVKVTDAANIYPLGTDFVPKTAGSYKLTVTANFNGHIKTGTTTLKVS
jgi:hypothetical protein